MSRASGVLRHLYHSYADDPKGLASYTRYIGDAAVRSPEYIYPVNGVLYDGRGKVHTDVPLLHFLLMLVHVQKMLNRRMP